jgi:hypothetical protein
MQYLSASMFPAETCRVPPNVKFLIDDIEDEWGYEKTPFDFIHARYLACSVKNFKKLVRQAYK